MVAFMPDQNLRKLLSNVFLLIGLIDIFVACLCVHMVLRYSPKSFGKYKWIQLNITLTIFYSDFWGVLSSVIFIPHFNGVLSVSKIEYGYNWSNFLLCMLADGILLQFSAKALAFYFRIFAFLPSNRQRLFAKGHFYGFLYVFTSIHAVPVAMYLSAPSSSLALLTLKVEEYPELRDMLNVTETIVLYDNDYYLFRYLKHYLFLMASCFAPCVVYGLSCVYAYLLKSKTISPKTKRLQIWLLKALVVQCTVPFFVCVVPYWTIVAAFYDSRLYLPYVTQYAELICCTHSTINGCLVIALTKPYYEQFRLMFYRSINRSPPTRTMSFVAHTTATRLFATTRS